MKRVIKTMLIVLVALVWGCQKQELEQPTSENARSTQAKGTIKEKCASHLVLEQQKKTDPARTLYLDKLEQATRNFKSGKLPTTTVRYIPVVMHIVLENSDIVTDELIQTQLDVLNIDFNAANQELKGNPYLANYPADDAGNMNVKFVLAQTVRVNTSQGPFSTNDGVKKSNRGGSDAINGATMLNVWVCDLGEIFLGYAQFPGGNEWSDGVVLDYRSFGIGRKAGFAYYANYALGRTATHEVGHWLNLYHIWGNKYCGDDLVGDTPQHDSPNFGCPEKTHTSLCAEGLKEQWMNYMDYTYDECLYLFTLGQQQRMEAAALNARAAYFRTSWP